MKVEKSFLKLTDLRHQFLLSSVYLSLKVVYYINLAFILFILLVMPTLTTEVLNWFLSIDIVEPTKTIKQCPHLFPEWVWVATEVCQSVSLEGCSCLQNWSVSTWHAAVDRLPEPHTPLSRLLTSHQVLKKPVKLVKLYSNLCWC